MLAKYLGHDGVYIGPYALASLIAEHFFNIVVGMDNLSQLALTSINDHDGGLCVVRVLIGVVVNFGGFF
jgi:hypothetical protein